MTFFLCVPLDDTTPEVMETDVPTGVGGAKDSDNTSTLQPTPVETVTSEPDANGNITSEGSVSMEQSSNEPHTEKVEDEEKAQSGSSESAATVEGVPPASGEEGGTGEQLDTEAGETAKEAEKPQQVGVCIVCLWTAMSCVYHTSTLN